MYGLLLESIQEMIKEKYGEEKWLEIRSKADIDEHIFVTHDIYSERIIPEICRAASSILDVPIDNVMSESGTHFVNFTSNYDYDRLLACLGRTMSDFLNGLDNLHEYIRFSYPKLRPPSFFCTDENEKGLTLHYRSKRRGFLYYVTGQIIQVGRTFYDMDIEVEILNSEYKGGMQSVTFLLKFDNKNFRRNSVSTSRFVEKAPALEPTHLFQIFPFHIVFDDSMTIMNVGNVLHMAIPYLVGKPIDQEFEMIRPLLDFSWDTVISHVNNVFELAATTLLRKPSKSNRKSIANRKSRKISENSEDSWTDALTLEVNPRRVRLKGQMQHIEEWNAIIFLCTPVMENIDAMAAAGLYVNDFSMHDSSRDLILAGTQQSTELKMALDQEQRKSAQLEESMRKLDVEIKKTDSLLYQMIPRPVAEKLRKGDSATSTCEVFPCVTILFSDVVGFTTICSRITPMEVVAMLNSMYTKFDNLCEQYEVYKVETIGDAYMIVSGAPIPTEDHALRVSEMAMAMIEAMRDLKEPDTGDHMKIRTGVHSGVVVAGVVGLKMPRYCLFGDTVNTASRMESTSEAQCVHISEDTKQVLGPCPYIIEERGSIEVKGKGSMKTYWLKGRRDDAPPFKGFRKLGYHDDSDIDDTQPVYTPVKFENQVSISDQPSHTSLRQTTPFQKVKSFDTQKPSIETRPKTKTDEKIAKAKPIAKKPLNDKHKNINETTTTPNNRKNIVKSPVKNNMAISKNSPLKNQLKAPMTTGKKVDNRQEDRTVPQKTELPPIEKPIIKEPNTNQLGSPVNKPMNTSSENTETELKKVEKAEAKPLPPRCDTSIEEEKPSAVQENTTTAKCSRLCRVL